MASLFCWGKLSFIIRCLRMRESSVILTIHGDQGIMDYSLDLRIGNSDKNHHVSCATEEFQLRKKSEVEADRVS